MTTTLVAPPRRGDDGRGREAGAAGGRQAGDAGGGRAARAGRRGLRAASRGRAGLHGRRHPAPADRRGDRYPPQRAVSDPQAVATRQYPTCVTWRSRSTLPSASTLLADSLKKNPGSASHRQIVRATGARAPLGGVMSQDTSVPVPASASAPVSSSPASPPPSSSASPRSSVLSGSRSRPTRCSRCGAFVPRVVVYPSRGDLGEREAGVCAVLWPALRGAAPASVSRIRFPDLALVVSLVCDVLARPSAVPAAVSLGRGHGQAPEAPVGGEGR
nr:MAG TPA: hypothetical protein [Caudoviricetes sp.]